MKIEEYLAPHQPVQETDGWVVYAKENNNARLLTNGEMHEYTVTSSKSVDGVIVDETSAYYDTYVTAYAAAVQYIADSCHSGNVPDESTVMVFK